MAEYRFCYGCRHSTYVTNHGYVDNHDAICLYCEKNRRFMSKRTSSSPLCFEPEDKNNPAYHSENHVLKQLL